MELKNVNIASLAALLRSCRGRVYFQTAEGDRLRADSLLYSIIGLSKVCQVARMQEMTLLADDAQDREKIKQFLQRPLSAAK